jgi:hypothetical protein
MPKVFRDKAAATPRVVSWLSWMAHRYGGKLAGYLLVATLIPKRVRDDEGRLAR